jgi:GT2 family glycosyltransferase
MSGNVTSAGSPSGSDPAVSIVIPTFNNLSLLLECIESVRRQDYPPEKIEIVVVDNLSTDRTREIIRDRFPYVKLLPLETNTGFAVACNRGATLAKGDYVAFLNNDAVADKGWLRALVDTLASSGETAVCVASRIVSHDASETEFDGAASNLFGAGRPTSVWGWPDAPSPPAKGSPILFASGGAMLIQRSVFLDVGGFDPDYFAYFEDVDLGWRLWVLGHRVVYAPAAVVKHLGGATARRTGEHRRYVLWECNALATIVKNYETGNMEQILSAALLLEYKRALLAAGDSLEPADYHLGGPADTNKTNVERLPKVSVAHLAAIDRLNSILPQLMESRRKIQARRKRSDAEILPLLGRPFEPQYAGKPYAEASRALAGALGLYGITAPVSPNRALLVGGRDDLPVLVETAERLKAAYLVAIALLGRAGTLRVENGNAVHELTEDDPTFLHLIKNADLLVSTPTYTDLETIRSAIAPVQIIGRERTVPLDVHADA